MADNGETNAVVQADLATAQTPSRAQSSALQGLGDPVLPPKGSNVRSPSTFKKHRSKESVDGGSGVVVNTALVLKNIPIIMSRDQMLAIMDARRLPKAYALNYHLDNGIFRGLAFANYRTAEEAEAVFVSLQGLELAGRKLRVEYKRVFPGTNAVMDQQQRGGDNSDRNRASPDNRGQRERDLDRRERELERRESMLKNSSIGSNPFANPVVPSFNEIEGFNLVRRFSSNEGTLRSLFNAERHHSPSASMSSLDINRDLRFDNISRPQPVRQKEADNLDLTVPEVKAFYDKVQLWKNTRPRSPVLEFPAALTATQRKTLHAIASKFGLHHVSEGEGDQRRLKMFRIKPQNEAIDNSSKGSPRSSPRGSIDALNLRLAKGRSHSVPSLQLRPSFVNADIQALSNFGPTRQPTNPDITKNFSLRKAMRPPPPPSSLNPAAPPFDINKISAPVIAATASFVPAAKDMTSSDAQNGLDTSAPSFVPKS